MLLEGAFLLIIILAVCIVIYRGAVHEFQILQKEYTPENDWKQPLSEQLPLVIRNLPRHLLGGWTHAKTAHKHWIVYIRQNRKKFRTTWAEWLKDPSILPENINEIATVARLQNTIQNWSMEGITRWSWLPPATPLPYIFGSEQFLGVSKTAAEFTVIVSTDGEPLDLWIAHEGAVPTNVADKLINKDPWIQTNKTIPWIGEVKYIEVKLRPGNAILIPKHWYYACKPSASYSWFWIGEFHTPISAAASAMIRKK